MTATLTTEFFSLPDVQNLKAPDAASPPLTLGTFQVKDVTESIAWHCSDENGQDSAIHAWRSRCGLCSGIRAFIRLSIRDREESRVRRLQRSYSSRGHQRYCHDADWPRDAHPKDRLIVVATNAFNSSVTISGLRVVWDFQWKGGTYSAGACGILGTDLRYGSACARHHAEEVAALSRRSPGLVLRRAVKKCGLASSVWCGCHILSCQVMSCHVMSCHVISCHVMSCHVMSCHAIMSCHVMSCHGMSCHVMSCHVMSCHVMSCHVRPV